MCLLTDDEFNQRLGISPPARTDLTAAETAQANQVIQEQIEANEEPVKNQLKIHQVLPIRIEGFNQLCFEIVFHHQSNISRYLTCFSLSQSIDEMHQTPTVIVERMNTHGQFLGYISDFRDSWIRRLRHNWHSNIAYKPIPFLPVSKAWSWGQFQASYDNIDLLFAEYIQAKIFKQKNTPTLYSCIHDFTAALYSFWKKMKPARQRHCYWLKNDKISVKMVKNAYSYLLMN